jgi:hypothetical protein
MKQPLWIIIGEQTGDAPKVHSLINFIMLRKLLVFLDGFNRHFYMFN